MRDYRFPNRQTLVSRAVAMYTEGKNAGEIAAALGKSRPSICLYLKSAGVETRRGPKRTFTLDEKFFDVVDTHTKAYWLGFLLADGHVSVRTAAVKVELKASDVGHLESLLKDVGSSSHVKWSERFSKGTETRPDATHRSCRVDLCSSHMKKSLLAAGWGEFKSSGDCKILDSVHGELVPSLMRGLFDGDGCFMDQRATFIDAHLSVVFWFQERMMEEAIRQRSPISPHPNGTSHVVKWSGKERLRAIRDFLYSTPGPRLPRKWERARDLY